MLKGLQTSIGAEKGVPIGLVTTLVGLYASQSVTGSMVQTALPVVLREQGSSLDQIGFLSILFLPWALKFLWAPLIDIFGTPRSWILSCQVLLAVCFCIAAYFPPATHMNGLILVMLAMAIFASTQDTATDAVGVSATHTSNRAFASGAATFGGYFGFLIGTGLWLWVYAKFGWAVSMFALAVTMLVLAFPSWKITRGVDKAPSAPGYCRPSFKRVLQNKLLIRGIFFIFLWQSGVRFANAMMGPIMVDAQLSIETIALVRGTLGMCVGLVAAVVGVALSQVLGGKRFLIAVAIAMILVSLGTWAWTLSSAQSQGVLIALILTISAITALSFVGVYAVMMNWCTPSQVATDFAVLQSFDAGLAIVVGIASGVISQRLGYAPTFLLAAALVLAGLIFLAKRPELLQPPSSQSK